MHTASPPPRPLARPPSSVPLLESHSMVGRDFTAKTPNSHHLFRSLSSGIADMGYPIYRGAKKNGCYVVVRYLFLLLLDGSACLCLGSLPFLHLFTVWPCYPRVQIFAGPIADLISNFYLRVFRPSLGRAEISLRNFHRPKFHPPESDSRGSISIPSLHNSRALACILNSNCIGSECAAATIVRGFGKAIDSCSPDWSRHLHFAQMYRVQY